MSFLQNATSPVARVPSHTEYVTVSLDDFNMDEIIEYVEANGHTAMPDSGDGITGDAIDGIFISPEAIGRLQLLAACLHTRGDARQEFLADIERRTGVRLS